MFVLEEACCKVKPEGSPVGEKIYPRYGVLDLDAAGDPHAREGSFTGQARARVGPN